MKPIPLKPSIKLEDLEKLDIRVGTIEKVEDIEASDKLVRLTVSFGEFKRTILVGMKKERENPAEIEDKQPRPCCAREAGARWGLWWLISTT